MRSRLRWIAFLCGFVSVAALAGAVPEHAGKNTAVPSLVFRKRNGKLRARSHEHVRNSSARRKQARRAAEAQGFPVREMLRDGSVLELQELGEGTPRYYATHNADAARTTRTDTVRQLSGGADGYVIGLWDGGSVRETHRELSPRVTWADEGGYSATDHATHVAGTMIASGIDLQAKGMASAAGVESYNWNNDLGEMAAAADDGLTVSNHSYGTVRGWAWYNNWYWFGDTAVSEAEDYLFGFYEEYARDIDEIACAAPYYLAVVSAGNDRNDSLAAGTPHLYWDSRYSGWRWSTRTRDRDGGTDGFDCISDGFQVAKNTLTVGAVEDVPVYTGPADVTATVFTSWGPTDDGRIKPDLVGNGAALYSSVAASDTSYEWKSGTSMSSPNVCGSLALLQHIYASRHAGRPMRGATLKALAVHAAREAGPAPGPDYMFGWGLLDTYGAYEHIIFDADSSDGAIEEFTLNEGYPVELFYTCDGAADELRVTICWTDPPGAPPPRTLDPTDPMLVNDLDLRISKGGSESLPWVLDPMHPADAAVTGDNVRDNVEQVVVTSPEAGTYVIRIDYKGTLEGGSQDFSLIVSGAEQTGIWHVYEDGSGDAPDIASAVSVADSGDFIFVYPGIYYEHDITIDKRLMIKGVGGAGNTTVDAELSGRCFVFPAGGDTVRIEDLTLAHGVALGSGAEGCGGAVYCASSLVTLVSCSIVRCEAREGGGVYVDQASPQLIRCSLFDNSSFGDGAGVYAHAAAPSLDHCVVAQNRSRSDGGGLYLSGSAPTVTNCSVSDNLAMGHGAGIVVGDGSDPTITNTIVCYSVIAEGVYGTPAAAGASLTCCDVYGNEGGDYSGSIPDQTGTAGNFSADPLFCDPGARSYGLGNSSPCLADGNPCGVQVGALGASCHTGTLIMVSADGSGDYATIQAAVDAAEPGDTVLLAAGTYSGTGNRNITFHGKSITILSEDGPAATVIDCEGAPGNHHHGIILEDGEDGDAVIEGVTVAGASKGAIRCAEGASPSIRNCVITGNVTIEGEDGGGIYLKASSARVSSCTISGNAKTGDGGGIECISATPVIERCVISDNSTDGGGGGVFSVQSTVFIEECMISGNAARDGAGLHNGIGSAMHVTGTIISGNAATNGGGGVYSTSGMTLENCTVVDNEAAGYGAGLEYFYGDQNEVVRSIVAYNRISGGIFTISNTMNISCSDVYGNEGGDYTGSTADQTGINDNISTDPLFCEFDSSNYYLYYSSPCIPDHSPCGGLIGAQSGGCWEQTDVPGNDTPPFTHLHSIYPNPFNPVTRIRFDLKRSSVVSINVYDVSGRRVRVLVSRVLEAGRHEIVWDGSADGGRSVASGVYFCRFVADGVVQTRKLVLLR